MALCESCGAQILWLRHVKSGKAAPIDAEGDQSGNVVRVGADQYRMLTKAERDAGAAQTTPLHLPHFATCPQAPAWKGKHRVTPTRQEDPR